MGAAGIGDSAGGGPAAARPAGLAAALGLAPEGLRICAAALALAVAAMVFGFPALGAVLLAAALAIAAFFRDPERVPDGSPAALVSAADGKVTDVRECPLPDGAPHDLRRRVSVFMSPLNVHVNRSPVTGQVVAITHTPGQFRAAFRDDANQYNERNLITFVDSAGRNHAIMQIAGYLARRIVCRLRPQDQVARGQRLGLIMFGSRVDHFLPLAYRVTVQVGDRVKAGQSVIGELMQ